MNLSETKMFVTMNLNVNNMLTFLFVIIELLGIIGNILLIICICIDFSYENIINKSFNCSYWML